MAKIAKKAPAKKAPAKKAPAKKAPAKKAPAAAAKKAAAKKASTPVVEATPAPRKTGLRTGPRSSRVEISKDESGSFGYTLYAGNGHLVYAVGGIRGAASAEKAATAFVNTAGQETNFTVTGSKDAGFRWVLKDGRKVIAEQNESSYQFPSRAKLTIRRIAAAAQSATIVTAP